MLVILINSHCPDILDYLFLLVHYFLESNIKSASNEDITSTEEEMQNL